MPDYGLLAPGTQRTAHLADDWAVVRAMLDVEVAWVATLHEMGVVPTTTVDLVVEVAGRGADVGGLASRGEAGANPVIPLVADLRAAVAERSPDAAGWVHRGLTSQDVLDSALMLVSARVLERLLADLDASASSAAVLARAHRHTVALARTLGQAAAPTTFGLKAAGWLHGILDVRESIADVAARLPVQCGGAVGTLASLSVVLPAADPLEVAAAFARHVGLANPGRPWHVTRAPVTRLGDALVTTADAFGHVAADVLAMTRPGVGEVSEPSPAGRGGSSTMPHKRNPVLSVMIRAASLRAPALASTLHLASATAVDERPDGAWQGEWPALQSLLVAVSGAAALGAELLDGLEVDGDAMRSSVEAAGPDLLGEWDALAGPGTEPSARPSAPDREPAGYLGASDALIDRALARLAEATS